MEARNYSYINRYELPMPNRSIGFYTLVGKEGVIAWMPDNEQQHLNPQYRRTKRIPIDFSNLASQDVDTLVDDILQSQDSDPVTIDNVTQIDVARMLGDVLSFRTKRPVSQKRALMLYESIIERMLQDLRAYRPETTH